MHSYTHRLHCWKDAMHAKWIVGHAKHSAIVIYLLVFHDTAIVKDIMKKARRSGAIND